MNDYTCGHDDEPFGTEGLCIDCHRDAYGDNHYPTAIRVEGLAAHDMFAPTCAFPCPVLDGREVTPVPGRADAVEQSRRLHRQARQVPTRTGWLANLEGI